MPPINDFLWGKMSFLSFRTHGNHLLTSVCLYIRHRATILDTKTNKISVFTCCSQSLRLYWTIQEKCDYLIKSGSQSPAVMDRWVLKVQVREQKKRHCEGVLQRELDGLDDEFSVLKFLSQELQVRANSIRNQRFQKAA